jgi:hypothetical protein
MLCCQEAIQDKDTKKLSREAAFPCPESSKDLTRTEQNVIQVQMGVREWEHVETLIVHGSIPSRCGVFGESIEVCKDRQNEDDTSSYRDHHHHRRHSENEHLKKAEHVCRTVIRPMFLWSGRVSRTIDWLRNISSPSHTGRKLYES